MNVDQDQLGNYIISVVLVNAYMIISLIIFMLLRSSPWIASRSPPISFVTAIACIINTNTILPMLEAFPSINANIPCLFRICVRFLFANIWIFSYVLRCIHILLTYILNQQAVIASNLNASINEKRAKTSSKAQRRASAPITETFPQANGHETDFITIATTGRAVFNASSLDNIKVAESSDTKTLAIQNKFDLFFFKLFKRFATISPKDAVDRELQNATSDTLLPTFDAKSHTPTVGVSQMSVYKSFQLLYGFTLLTILAILFGVIFSKNQYLQNPGLTVPQCVNTIEEIGIRILYCIVLYIFFPIFLYLIRNVQDSYWIGRELTFILTISIVHASLAFLGEVLGLFYLPGNLFSVIHNFVAYTASVVLPIIFAIVSQFSNKKVLLKYDTACFEYVLRNRSLYGMFKEQVAKDLCMENILFYEQYMLILAAIEQSQTRSNASHLLPRMMQLMDANSSSTVVSLLSNDELAINKELTDLYQDFIKTNSENELNIPDSMRKAIERKASTGQLGLQDFDPVLKEVKDLMYKNNFPRFVAKHTASLKSRTKNKFKQSSIGFVPV